MSIKSPDAAKEIFLAAIEIESPSERARYLDDMCGGDDALRKRVEALIVAHERPESLLDHCAPRMIDSLPADATVELSNDDAIGSRIGPYRLLQELGEGGMGVVYLAERQQPIKQYVALKIIKQGMDSKKSIARFEAERQALAIMDHPNIAKVLDAGCTEHGRLYFAMELVKGVPISQFCDDQRLTTRDRLELFNQVCNAVHHAHQKGIIHRDIKPSNVLVALYDQKPVPKVIDFGVAKAMDQRLTDKTLFTEVGSILGTWEYMSPEQAVLNQLDVDTRTDVYSLGVLLYELLTGETPLDRKQLRQAQLMETLRMIREDEPSKPSTRISTLGEQAASTAACRGAVTPESLASEIRGDLDWVVMKALAKERSRRYDSASRLGEDIERFLRNELVEARPPSTWYQLKKLYDRNRVLASSIAAIILALSLGLAVALNAIGERNQALKDWLKELEQRALIAAFSGDRQEVESLLEKASMGGQNPNWADKVLGQLAVHEGRGRDAIGLLTDYLQIKPDDLGAHSMLTQAYLITGDHSRYLAHREKLSEFRAYSAFDQLLYAAALIDGNNEEGLNIIERVIKDQPSPIAFAMRCHGRMKMFWHDYDDTWREESLRDLDRAKSYMPNHPWVAALEFYAHFVQELRGKLSDVERLQMLDALERAQPVVR